jgi:predicted RNase H-like HicB family nuclease
MPRTFTLEYCLDDSWHIGRLKEVPGVISQGITLSELQENIRDAYQLVTEDAIYLHPSEIQTKEITAEAWASHADPGQAAQSRNG